jgi:hypothetical protein
MNKLETITNFLEERREIKNDFYTFREEEIYYPNRGVGGWTHTLNCLISPKEGIYSAPELQEFMLSFIPPTLIPEHIKNFSLYDNKLELGVLNFYELIGGEEKVISTLTDEYILQKLGFDIEKPRVETRNHNYNRRIWLSFYPRRIIMEEMLLGYEFLRHEISLENLEIYKKRLLRPTIFGPQ